PLGDLRHAAVAEVAPGAERAVGLEHDLALLAGLEQRAAVLERAELHLVDVRLDVGDAEQLVELGDAEVRAADRARVAALARPLHPVPRPRRPALGPVDDVEVDVVDAEPLEAALRLGLRVLAGGVELRRDEDLLARDAAVAQRAPDAALVAVRLGGV